MSNIVKHHKKRESKKIKLPYWKNTNAKPLEQNNKSIRITEYEHADEIGMELKGKYEASKFDMLALKLNTQDTLVIYLCGLGITESGSFVLGDNHLLSYEVVLYFVHKAHLSEICNNDQEQWYSTISNPRNKLNKCFWAIL